jgi:protease II
MLICSASRQHAVRAFLLFALMVACAPLVPILAAQPLVPPPPTPVRVVADTLHGVVIEDPYRWLEDQQAPETRTWIDAQNDYATANLDRFPFRKQVAARLGEILKVDRFTSPIERGGRYFFQRRMPDQEQYVLYVREGLNGADRVLIDPHKLSPDFTTSVNIMDASMDGTLLAYALRKGGEDEVEIRFLDVATGQETGEALPRNNYYGLSIAPDKARCYYSVHDERGTLLLVHRFGTVISADPVLFGEGLPPEKILETSLSEDGRYLLIHVYEGSAGTRNEVYYADLLTGGEIVPLVTDVDANFFGQTGGDRVYMSSNWNAPNWRILAADLKNPARENWVEVVPNGKAVIQSFSLVGGRIYVNYLDEVKSRVQIFEVDGRPAGEIRFPTIGSIGGMGARPSSASSRSTSRSRSTATMSSAARKRSGRGPAPRSTRTRSKSSRSGSTPRTARACRCSSSIARTWSPTARARRCSPATAGSTSPGRLTSPRRPPTGWSRAASTPSPACAAAASSATSGTGPRCMRRSRTVSMTSSRRPSG